MKTLPLAALLALTLSVPTLAQQPADTAELPPVVVTATRIPTMVNAVPAAVTVMSGADLRREGMRTVADALRRVPAANVVTTDAYGSQTSLFLRGGEADYVKVLIDGVPQIGPGGPGTAYDFANLTTDNVDRIEVVRGPVSVLYGSDAVTGVVQIFTRSGRGPARQSLALTGGTYGSGGVEANVAGGTERGSYSFGVSHFASDGIYPVNNQYRNDVVTGRFQLRPDARTDLALAVHYGDALYHFPTDGSGAIVSDNQHQLERGPSVGLDIGRAFSPRIEARLAAGWDRENYLYSIARNGPTDTTTFPYASSDWMTRQTLDAHANVRLHRTDVLTVGATLERESMEGTTLDTSRARNDGAAYLQLVTGLDGPVSVTLGARLDDNQRFGTWSTYRAGASVRLASHTRGIVSIGTGFKEPSFYQNFATGFVIGNPDLKPEHSFSWEVGLAQTIPGTAALVRATYFNQRFRDLIDYNGADSVTNYFNVPGANVSGVEVAVDAPLRSTIHLTAGYTWLDAHVTQGGASTGPTALFVPGATLIRRPRSLGNAGLSYLLKNRGSVSVRALYVGDRQDLDYATFQRVTLPAYLRFDLAANADVVRARGTTPGLAASVSVENLFDRAYEEIQNFPARGRTILVGAQVRFGY